MVSQFTVAGTASTQITVFDLDGTLLDSGAQVIVTDGHVSRHLTQTEYDSYKLKPGERYDYSEFCSMAILNNSTILPCWSRLVAAYSAGRHVCILTARSDHRMVWEFFNEHGLDIKRALIFTINSPDCPFRGRTVADRKAEAIKHLTELGYRAFTIYDDSLSNLEAMERACGESGAVAEVVRADIFNQAALICA